MNEKPRIVIDTQILLRAIVNRRSLPAKIVFDLAKVYELVVSEGTLDEITELVQRPKIRAKFSLSDEAIDELLVRLSGGDHVVVTTVPAISRDPKDDVFLACAEAGKANYIVSEDNDLLVLNPYQSIQIVNALDFFKIISPPSD